MGLARFATLPKGPEWLRVVGYVDSLLDKSVVYLVRNGQFSKRIYIPRSQLEVQQVRVDDRDIVVRAWVVEKNGWPSKPVAELPRGDADDAGPASPGG